MNMQRTFSIAILLQLCLFFPVSAQQVSAPVPPSGHAPGSFVSYLREVPITSLAAPDLMRVHAEDLRNPGTRLAVPLPADMGVSTAGTWTELPDGAGVWHLKIQSAGALGLMALYDDFYIPEGASLFMYSGGSRTVLGPFTSRDNPLNGKFITGFTAGDEAVLEYYEPAAVRGQGRLHLSRVDYAYHRQQMVASGFDVTGSLGEELGFGSTDSCQINTKCQTDADTAAAKRAACRMVTVSKEGSGYCTGSPINNTAEDGTPLMISAFHCQDGYTPYYDLWRFDFGYESPDCANPGTEPGYKSVVGCVRRAGYRETDFLLLELLKQPTAAHRSYFLGWDRSSTPPSKALILHHPRGDIKKVSLDSQALSVFQDSIDWNNGHKTPPGNHFQSRFDLGSFDIGSSGAALLNASRHFVGQLHGGYMDCKRSAAYFGRLSQSWEGGGTPETRLKDWLDPDNTGLIRLPGMENPANAGWQVAGVILTENGVPVPKVRVNLVTNNGVARSAISDTSGYYRLNAVPFDEPFEISLEKEDFAANGCTTTDLLKVQKHILGFSNLETSYQWIAADVNRSNTVSTQDLVQMRKIVLGVETAFSAVPAWTFIPASFEFVNGPNPFHRTPLPLDTFLFKALEADIPDLDFVGIKYGDVNGSVDTKH